MQIILRGAKQPNGCGECHFCDRAWSDPRCCARSRTGRKINRTYNLNSFKPAWCPITEGPKQLEGEWKDGFCTICGSEAPYDRNGARRETSFCPECGAMMQCSMEEDESDRDDPCEECRIYGDDYSYDEDGDSVCNCEGCCWNDHFDDD